MTCNDLPLEYKLQNHNSLINSVLNLVERLDNLVCRKLSYCLDTMEYLPKNDYLIHPPGTLEVIRELYDLHQPGALKDAVNILDEWVKKQAHFKKKDFIEYFLESSIIASKGSIERAKRMIDNICTFRTLFPQYFGTFNAKKDFGNLFDFVNGICLPKLTSDFYRVYVIKMRRDDFDPIQFLDYYRYGVLVADYLRIKDYMSGFIIVIDFTSVSLMEMLKKINPIELKQALTIFIEGYGMRLKGMYILTPSGMVNAFINLFKQILNPKLASRIHAFKSTDALAEVFPIDILPADYGGKDISIKDMQDRILDLLTEDDFMEYLKDINTAGTDENYRPVDKFNDQYAGVAGTFRMLKVD